MVIAAAKLGIFQCTSSILKILLAEQPALINNSSERVLFMTVQIVTDPRESQLSLSSIFPPLSDTA